MSGFVALTLAVVAIVAGGASMTPRYGTLPPWQTSPVADLRSAPRPIGWSTDLSRDMLPGVPPDCSSFGASTPTGRLVVVTAQSPSVGSRTPCSSASASQVDATVALLDTDDGRILWTNDLARQFPSAVSTLSIAATSVFPSVDRVLVQFVVDGQYTLAALSATNGSVLGITQLGADDTGTTPEVAGSLVLYGASTSREGATRWTVADVRHLDKPLWSEETASSVTPLLTAHAVFADVDGRSVRVDGVTGRITDFGGGTVDLTSVLAVGNSLYSVSDLPNGGMVTAWNDSGRQRWARAGVGEVVGVSRGCVVAMLLGTTTATCLDPTTGDALWRASVDSRILASWMTGQTTDDVAIYSAVSTTTHLTVLDGATGRHVYTLAFPANTYVAAVSRTTGYLLATTDAGTTTGVEAFDVATGRILWKRTDTRPGSIDLWGGRLVNVSSRGIVTELANPRGFVLDGSF